MLSKEITITVMGAIAQGSLAQENKASVMGFTSRGMFLLLQSGWVVFLSPEVYRGPMTLNHKGDHDHFRLLKNGQPANIIPDRILFPDTGLMINIGQAVTWEAPPPPQGVLPPEQRKSQLMLIARQLLDRRQTSMFSELLPVLLGLVKRSSAQGNPVLSILGDVQRSLGVRRMAVIADRLEALLGMGSGLTPSGDDLVIGLLFTLARWGYVLAPNFNVEALGQEILPRAYRKTTTLSANMIDCALRGQANERLLLALDGIMSGTADAEVCSAYLAGWGNTSGLDALVGIALALGVEKRVVPNRRR